MGGVTRLAPECLLRGSGSGPAAAWPALPPPPPLPLPIHHLSGITRGVTGGMDTAVRTKPGWGAGGGKARQIAPDVQRRTLRRAPHSSCPPLPPPAGCITRGLHWIAFVLWPGAARSCFSLPRGGPGALARPGGMERDSSESGSPGTRSLELAAAKHGVAFILF